jgi:hypothetical protein
VIPEPGLASGVAPRVSVARFIAAARKYRRLVRGRTLAVPGELRSSAPLDDDGEKQAAA